MSDNIDNKKYSFLKGQDYKQWFQSVQYNGKTLSDAERKDLVDVINQTVSQYSKGLPLLQNVLNGIKGQDDEFHNAQRTVVSVMQFVLITMIDSMVVSKYLILADGDYDKRFMRGKLMVILNEGFKRLYGFDEKTHKKSEWNRLSPIMKHFTGTIYSEYQELTSLLDIHSKSSSWWREERNIETHLDTERLYNSRQEEIIESKVMMDSLKLYSTLFAVDIFLTKVHGCLLNFAEKMFLKENIQESIA